MTTLLCSSVLFEKNGSILGVRPGDFYSFALSDYGDLDDAELNEFAEEAESIRALRSDGSPSDTDGGLIAQAIAQQGVGTTALVPTKR